MKGGPWKTRKRKARKTLAKNDASTPVASPVTEESNMVSQSPACSTPRTPKRTRTRGGQTEDICRTSTPLHKTTATGADQAAEVDSPESKAKLQTDCSTEPRSLRKRASKEQTKAPQAKRRCGRKQEVKTETAQRDTPPLSSERCRPRFELKSPDTVNQDETLQSSDLSIELSHYEEPLPSLSFEEEEEESEDEELPSFLMQKDKKPPSIKEGAFVWHKMRNFPFWPALVKKVHRKQKRANIVFIDDQMSKGFSVGLKLLKPYDCEESLQLECEAKEKYAASIQWSTDLITDYRMRIACGSFSGSFMEYFAHDMSFPVRRNYPRAASERLTITSDSLIEELSDDSEEEEEEEEESNKEQKVSRSSKRLLPDRTQAAYNRANQKLVHFIVKQRLGEERLLAVIRRQQQSTWLRSFLSAKRGYGVNTYLEDEQQLNQVFKYLQILFEKEKTSASGKFECVSFVLEVLLPEAIICAIAGVENVSLQQAEKKYLRGRRISNREKQAFDEMIEKQRKSHSIRPLDWCYSEN